jgi:hypothetical protein
MIKPHKEYTTFKEQIKKLKNSQRPYWTSENTAKIINFEN